jgi:hypothetical protein
MWGLDQLCLNKAVVCVPAPTNGTNKAQISTNKAQIAQHAKLQAKWRSK